MNAAGHTCDSDVAFRCRWCAFAVRVAGVDARCHSLAVATGGIAGVLLTCPSHPLEPLIQSTMDVTWLAPQEVLP